MSQVTATPFPGARTPSLPVRLLVVLVALLLLAGPLLGVAADPLPTPSHTDHVGEPDAAGCHAFHDELFCQSCRALSTPPVTSHVPPLPFLLERPTLLVDRSVGATGRAAVAALRARAPPRT